MNKIILSLIIILLASCETFDETTELLGENVDIVGTWAEAGYEDDITLLNRVEELDQDKYGFIIEADGKFTERKNAGWCGTPPIYYDNFEGQWVAKTDSLLEITVGFWGGTMTYKMHIVSLSSDELRVRYAYDYGN